MVRRGPLTFRAIWLVDFEFLAGVGEPPSPVCLVAHELISGRWLRIWHDELLTLERPPYDIDPDCLFVAFYASAEIGCHLALDWSVPCNVLDLFAEFRTLTNGRVVPCGNGLIGALTWFGLDSLAGTEKERMRALVLRGGPWTPEEQTEILSYCESDVAALGRLFECMRLDLDLPRALLRGRFMVAAARMEHIGMPIDSECLALFRDELGKIQDQLIGRSTRTTAFLRDALSRRTGGKCWLMEKGIAWPRLPSGSLALDDDTFREMARVDPRVAPMRELRVSLSQMRLGDLAVGLDGRNRCLLSAYRARTGRNQPSNTKFIFGPAVWLRGLIRPEPGYGLAYIDWAQQEFGIAASLSGDEAMIDAYESADPYLSFAKQAGAIPKHGTKLTHGNVREQFKACALAVQYGMEARSLAQRIGQPEATARELLRLHHQTYPKFWRWSDAAVDFAMLHGYLYTVYGWTIRVGPEVNPRSLRNFPMQANGAEMLRLACCLATERGIRVCAPIHDAILIEAPLDDLEATVEATRLAMAEASAVVLGGFQLRTEATVVRYPDRYQDPRGTRMWTAVWDIINQVAGGDPGMSAQVTRAPMPHYPCTGAHPPNLLISLL